MKKLICLLLAVALTGIAACGTEPSETQTPTAPTQIELPTEAPTEPTVEVPTEAPTEQTEIPEEEPAVPVSDALRFTRVFRENDIDITLSLAIPRIDLEYETIGRLNKVIYDEMADLFYDAVASMRNGGAPAIRGMGYEATVKGNALSLVITTEYNEDVSNVRVYCVDIHTGNLMTHGGIASVMGVTEGELNDAIAGTAREQFVRTYTEYEGNDAYQMLLDQTVSPENLEQAQCFFDREGKLMVAVQIYSFVGARYYTCILPVTF